MATRTEKLLATLVRIEKDANPYLGGYLDETMALAREILEEPLDELPAPKPGKPLRGKSAEGEE